MASEVLLVKKKIKIKPENKKHLGVYVGNINKTMMTCWFYCMHLELSFDGLKQMHCALSHVAYAYSLCHAGVLAVHPLVLPLARITQLPSTCGSAGQIPA